MEVMDLSTLSNLSAITNPSAIKMKSKEELLSTWRVQELSRRYPKKS